jgi:hypothetical protein
MFGSVSLLVQVGLISCLVGWMRKKIKNNKKLFIKNYIASVILFYS